MKRNSPAAPDQTQHTWSKAMLIEIVDLTSKTHGLDLSPFDETFFAKSLDKRLAATQAATQAAYAERLTHDYSEAVALLHSLKIVYSEFFRNQLAFALLEQQILPSLIEERQKSGSGEIRVWSAGCASGQEAWSVAILLAELTGGRESPVSYRIIATDLSESDLDLASCGVYSADAIGNVRSRHLREYFSRKGDSFTIAPRLRERVDFLPYDLLDENTTCPPESIFGNFDLVLCSNVLFYYRPEMQRLILSKVWRCLASGGHLLTDQSEQRIVTKACGFLCPTPPAALFTKI